MESPTTSNLNITKDTPVKERLSLRLTGAGHGIANSNTSVLKSQIAEIRQEVQHILGVRKFKANGFSARNVSCPFHKDTHPSASLHEEKGLYCHSCSRWYTWKALAGKLGVEWKFSHGESQKIHKYLTDEVIQKLNARRRLRACQVLSELYRTGHEGQTLSIKTIAEITFCSRNTVYQMAKDGLLSFVHYLPTSYNIQEGGKQSTKLAEGRKPRLLRVPVLSELEDVLGCDGTMRRYTMEVSENRAELKAEVMSLPVKRAKDRTAQLSSKYLGKAAGVKSPKTVRKYMKMVTEITEDVESHALTITEFKAMPENHEAYRAARKTGWKCLQVRETKYTYDQEQALLAIASAGSLENVMVVTQKAHIYHYVGIPQMSEEVKQFVHALQNALVLRKRELERKNEWAKLMDGLDEKIRIQKEQEQTTQWRQDVYKIV